MCSIHDVLVHGIEHLEGAMRSLSLKLDRGAMRRLDEIWPGPGGPAPEAFAW